MPAAALMTQAAVPAVCVREVSRTFGTTRALTKVSLDLAAGSVHAFVGQNGAGKSTLLGILAGRVPPSEGQVDVFGRPLALGDPRSARAAGVVAIYQELTIVPALSACENVFVGQWRSRFGVVTERAMRERFLALCRRLDLRIDPDAPAGLLSIADQQMLEILRALETDARIILLDEPTAALPPSERDALFGRLRELRADGVTMVLVSHNLDEILDIADHVSVFRDGRLVRTAPVAEWTKRSLVTAMLGHAPPEHAICSRTVRTGPLLRAEGITVPGKIEDVSIDIAAGEILGIGGLMGAGRTTLLRALVGLEEVAAGRLWIDGAETRWPRNPAQALALGIALIPEDRKRHGLVGVMSAQDNIVMTNLGALARFGLLAGRQIEQRAARLARDYGLDPRRLNSPAATLSGGNQQKAILARWQHRLPRVLLADEPTRGIDVGAKEDVLGRLRTLADGGLSVVLVSSELGEVANLSDRILVLAAGRTAGVLPANADVAAILHAAFSV